MLENSKSKRKATVGRQNKDTETVILKEDSKTLHKDSVIHPSEQVKKARNNNLQIENESYFAEGKATTYKNLKISDTKNEHPQPCSGNIEKLKQFKFIEKRINPKWAQENNKLNDKQGKVSSLQWSFISKEDDSSITVKQMPWLNVKKMTNIVSREQNPFKVISNFDNDGSPFDSLGRSESEHEEELDVKPERISFGPRFSDTESENGGLRLNLKQWEYASNSSATMTPRLEREWNNHYDNGKIQDFEYLIVK